MKKIIEITVCDWCGGERKPGDLMHRIYFPVQDDGTDSVQAPIDIHEGCRKDAVIGAVMGRKACKSPTT